MFGTILAISIFAMLAYTTNGFGGIVETKSESANTTNAQIKPSDWSKAPPKAQQPQPPQQQTQQGLNNQNNTATTPNAGITACDYFTILYGVEYIEDPTMDVGKSRTEVYGQNGQEKTCYVSSSSGVQTTTTLIRGPVKQVIYHGTNVPSLLPPEPKKIDYTIARNNCAAITDGWSSAFNACMRGYGY